MQSESLSSNNCEKAAKSFEIAGIGDERFTGGLFSRRKKHVSLLQIGNALRLGGLCGNGIAQTVLEKVPIALGHVVLWPVAQELCGAFDRRAGAFHFDEVTHGR